MKLIKELNEQGHTIILITHDLEIAKQAKRVIRIQDGQITERREALVH
jgi:putative ABC transport system ATP-binding protein